MARPLSDRPSPPAPLLLGGPAGPPPGGGALLGLRSLLQGTSKPKDPASCESSSPPGPAHTHTLSPLGTQVIGAILGGDIPPSWQAGSILPISIYPNSEVSRLQPLDCTPPCQDPKVPRAARRFLRPALSSACPPSTQNPGPSPLFLFLKSLCFPKSGTPWGSREEGGGVPGSHPGVTQAEAGPAGVTWSGGMWNVAQE